MTDRLRSRRLRGLVALALAIAVPVVLAVGSASAGSTAASCGKVRLNEQAWAGSTANTYIAKYVLEQELGCEVEITKITEIPVFQAMAFRT